jgi:16S rRNA A1518/A1519 N6-dimethyltransferase RsmA/KsgA/DIM1 with predicted DNA glycosylase/AP lyase activity
MNEQERCPADVNDNGHVSVSHRPSVLSKSDVKHSPVKRHSRETFRPAIVTAVDSPHVKMHRSPADVQLSHDSTWTQVTSISIVDQQRSMTNNELWCDNPTKSIDTPSLDNDREHWNVSTDELLNILERKRDQLLLEFR